MSIPLEENKTKQKNNLPVTVIILSQTQGHILHTARLNLIVV